MLALDMAIRYRWRGDRLKRLREHAQLSETELAAQVGVTAQAVKKWEGGKVPKLLAFAALVRALHCEHSDLIELEI